MIDTYKLAMLTLEMLAYEDAYFKSRDPQVFADWKKCECEVKTQCQRVRDEHNNGLRLDLK